MERKNPVLNASYVLLYRLILFNEILFVFLVWDIYVQNFPCGDLTYLSRYAPSNQIVFIVWFLLCPILQNLIVIKSFCEDCRAEHNAIIKKVFENHPKASSLILILQVKTQNMHESANRVFENKIGNSFCKSLSSIVLY